ncbi:MAG: phosphate acyltransferase PlsX [Ignavibacteria bacterium]|jgi:glycerol-3-phosphate acyltransferase PlsX
MKDCKCRIVVDAMGGDYAPLNVVLGAVEAVEDAKNIDVVLVGKKEEILQVLRDNNKSFNEDNIVNASQVIEMKDGPTASIKEKTDSSISIGAKLVKEGNAEAFVSAGNSGAVMAAATLIMGRLKGVSRPTIGAAMPTEKGGSCNVYDVGASVDSKAHHLLEYALLGSIYSREMLDIKNPSVGLLSVGEEDSKGNDLTFAASKLLKEAPINFYGNVEGRDIMKGTVDIVVCDGFVGNIVLKLAESFLGFLKTKITKYAEEGIINKLKALVAKFTLKSALKDIDYQSYGGVPLLGVNGICIIGHGSSSVLAIKNMIFKAKEMCDKKLIQKFNQALEEYGKSK